MLEFRDIYRFYRNYTAEKFKHRKQMSLLKKICTYPQIYTLYELWEILKHPLLSRKQSLESSNTGIWVGGAWVVNTPVREHNEHFRATCSPYGSPAWAFEVPDPHPCVFKEMTLEKGNTGKKGKKSSVLFFSSIHLCQNFGWSGCHIHQNPDCLPTKTQAKDLYVSRCRFSKYSPFPLDFQTITKAMSSSNSSHSVFLNSST